MSKARKRRQPAAQPDRQPDPRHEQLARGFINSPWRYSQFVVVGAIVMALLRALAGLPWWLAIGIGALAGIGLWLVEKKRGVL